MEPGFLAFLAERLTEPLPGLQAHVRMAPLQTDLSRLPPDLSPPPQARRSAVLAAITEAHDGLRVLLTLRRQDLNKHGGQLCFPGGGIDKGESPHGAALRETHEETGLPPDRVEILGELSPLYIPPSNNYVRPFLGRVQSEYPVYPDPSEVEEAFWMPLGYLIEPARRKVMRRRISIGLRDVPYWDIHRIPLWGATAMMLSELVMLYEEFIGGRALHDPASGQQ